MKITRRHLRQIIREALVDDVSLKSSSSMVEPIMRAIAENPPEGLTVAALESMSAEAREELRLKLDKIAEEAASAIRTALERG